MPCCLSLPCPIGLSLPCPRSESTSINTMCASVCSLVLAIAYLPAISLAPFLPILSLLLFSLSLRPITTTTTTTTPQMVLGTVILGVCYVWARHLGHIKTFCDISDLVVHLPERRCTSLYPPNVPCVYPHSTRHVPCVIPLPVIQVLRSRALRSHPRPPTRALSPRSHALRSTRRAALPHTASDECLGPVRGVRHHAPSARPGYANPLHPSLPTPHSLPTHSTHPTHPTHPTSRHPLPPRLFPPRRPPCSDRPPHP